MLRPQHEAWMRRALSVASASPEDVPVGAVVYDAAGTELAAAGNERELTGDPTAHAEILALRRAAARTGSWRLDGCTLVVTLEPCTMCAGALVLARVSRLVFGAWEPKTGAVGLPLGRGPGPAPEPPPRGLRGRAGDRMRGAAARLLPGLSRSSLPPPA